MFEQPSHQLRILISFKEMVEERKLLNAAEKKKRGEYIKRAKSKVRLINTKENKGVNL